MLILFPSLFCASILLKGLWIKVLLCACVCVCLKRERLKENNTFICVFIQVFSCSSGNLPSHGLVHTIRRCVCMELKQGNFNSIPHDTQCSFTEKHTRTLSPLSSQSFKIQNITTYLIWPVKPLKQVSELCANCVMKSFPLSNLIMFGSSYEAFHNKNGLYLFILFQASFTRAWLVPKFGAHSFPSSLCNTVSIFEEDRIVVVVL